MLPKKNRITKDKEFASIFKRHKQVRNDLFIIRFKKNEFDYPRFAIIISNKVSKKATERNKLKRRISSILFDNLSKFKQNNDILITVLNNSLRVEFTVLENNLLSLLSKIN